MRITFAVAAMLILLALTITVGTYDRTLRNRGLAPEAELSRTSAIRDERGAIWPAFKDEGSGLFDRGHPGGGRAQLQLPLA